MTRAVLFNLPWPPSVNHYWQTITIPIAKGSNKRRAAQILSERARDYRILVASAVRSQRVPCNVLTGKLQVHFTAFPPDRRERDLDNLFKGMLDSLVHASVLRNDSEVDDLRIVRRHVIQGGSIQVHIAEIAGEATVSGELFETRAV